MIRLLLSPKGTGLVLQPVAVSNISESVHLQSLSLHLIKCTMAEHGDSNLDCEENWSQG